MLDSHPVHSRVLVGSRRRTRCGGTARFSTSYSPVDSAATFAFDVSVATCARLLRPLSRTQLTADCQGHFCKPRRDAVSAFVTRDAFRRSRFERLPPHGVSLLLRWARLESRWSRRLRLLDPPDGFSSPLQARARSPFGARARGVPTRLASACVVAVPVRG